MKNKRLFLLVLMAVLLSGILAACSSQPVLSMAPLDQMPEQVRSAPVSVQQAYQFAMANPDLMKQIPCYCGCGAIGHTSNYACYVNDGGEVDNHALGCSICVDITHDVMRLIQQGKSPLEIKNFIDSTYSKYGTSNMP